MLVINDSGWEKYVVTGSIIVCTLVPFIAILSLMFLTAFWRYCWFVASSQNDSGCKNGNK